MKFVVVGILSFGVCSVYGDLIERTPFDSTVPSMKRAEGLFLRSRLMYASGIPFLKNYFLRIKKRSKDKLAPIEQCSYRDIHIRKSQIT